MDLHGATERDFAQVKVKNARHGLANPNARYRKEVSVEEVLASPMVSDPLRLLQICATSDGGAAVVVASREWARGTATTTACGSPGSRPSPRPSRTW
jgi:acetyl-CoA acetyltransferase